MTDLMLSVNGAFADFERSPTKDAGVKVPRISTCARYNRAPG